MQYRAYATELSCQAPARPNLALLDSLPQKQRQCYMALRGFVAIHGRPPTTRELARLLGLPRPSHASYYIRQLTDAGLIVAPPAGYYRRAADLRLVDVELDPQIDDPGPPPQQTGADTAHHSETT